MKVTLYTVNNCIICISKCTAFVMYAVNCNGQTSCVNNYFYCCIQPEDLYDAECDLCAIAKFFVTVSVLSTTKVFNPLLATLKPQSNGPSYSNTVIGTLAVDGWAVSFGT